MKVVKLNKTHGLYREGYTHALRFPNYSTEATRIEKAVSRRFGSSLKSDAQWDARFGTKTRGSTSRTYWIGFKSEAMLTMTLLGL